MTQDCLPLPLARTQTTPRDTLPLPLGGEQLNAPSPKPRRRAIAAAEFGTTHSAAELVALCRAAQAQAAALQHKQTNKHGDSHAVSACQGSGSRTTTRPAAYLAARHSDTTAISGCLNVTNSTLRAAQHGVHIQTGSSLFYHNSSNTRHSAAALLRGCPQGSHSRNRLLQLLLNGVASGSLMATCSKSRHGYSVQPPCEWYPRPLVPPPEPAPPLPCGKPPPAHRQPLPMRLRQTAHSARCLPLPLSCFHISQIPNRESYIVLNHISARIDGQSVQCLSAQVQTDRNGYCWQGSIGIAPQDFAQFDWDAPRETPMSLEITINGETFVLMAEEYGDSRKFGEHSYTIGGRSPSALLGADYAKWQHGGNSQALDASQLARAQAKPFGFTLDWRLPDWRIPADVYRFDDKTPIGVLQDMAQALGAFVSSHPSERRLRLAPRWPQAAWRVALAVPDVVVPESLILQISGQKQLAVRANGVFVLADHAQGRGADVYRKGSGREPRASTLSHPLYTDTKACYAAGIAALSDSGTHRRETLTLPLAAKYGVVRAELGQIWRVDEGGKSWFGVVDGVALQAAADSGGALTVTQTVQLDRYLGD